MPHYISHKASSIKKKKSGFFFFLVGGLFWFFSTLSSWKPQPPIWKSASAHCGSIIPVLNLSMPSFKRGVDNPVREHSDWSTAALSAVATAPSTFFTTGKCSLLLPAGIDKSWCIFSLPTQHSPSVSGTKKNSPDSALSSVNESDCFKICIFP